MSVPVYVEVCVLRNVVYIRSVSVCHYTPLCLCVTLRIKNQWVWIRLYSGVENEREREREFILWICCITGSESDYPIQFGPSVLFERLSTEPLRTTFVVSTSPSVRRPTPPRSVLFSPRRGAGGEGQGSRSVREPWFSGESHPNPFSTPVLPSPL